MVNKVAVVIGATGSVGSEVVAELSSRGYEIDPTWMTNSRPDATCAESYKRLPPKVHAAIYIPGLNIIQDIASLEEEEWTRVFDVNVKGAYLFAKAAFPALKAAGRGSFVTISSILATHPYPGRAAYGASKAAHYGYTPTALVAAIVDTTTIVCEALRRHPNIQRRGFMTVLGQYGRHQGVRGAYNILPRELRRHAYLTQWGGKSFATVGEYPTRMFAEKTDGK